MGPPQPEVLPDHVAVPVFWKQVTRFALFVASTTAVLLATKHVEENAHAQLLDGVI
jgi:hypothetical protein